MPTKSCIALAAFAAVLLATAMVPVETASAEQLTARKKNTGLLLPAVQKVREPAARLQVNKRGPAKTSRR